MNNLTALEKKVLNGVSKVYNPGVALGDKIEEMISVLGESGTPVNAVAAASTLSISGVSIHGDKLTINNPTKVGVDVYEFLADEAQIKSAPTNIAVNITTQTVKSNGTLTVDTQPISGDTFTIGAKTYIFTPVGTANAIGEISIGADLAAAQAAIVAAINGTDGVNTPHPTVRAGAFAANASTITALIGGTVNNTVGTIETFTAVTNIFAAATLGSGANCSAVNTVLVLIAAITASDTQDVVASSGAGNSVILTADNAGIAGNNIEIVEAMTNASFVAAATKLNGGVDGTVAVGTKFMIDESYLYVCLNGNSTRETNWRRISIGSAY